MKNPFKNLKQTLEKTKILIQKRKIFNTHKREELIQKFKDSIISLNELELNQIKEKVQK